jgi:hypothetical protein
MKKTAIFLVCIFFTAPVRAPAAERFQEPIAMQISSSVSDGTYSLDEIVRITRQNNVKIIILGDRDLMKWEYGLWPLRGLVKKTVEDKSLLRYGVRRYLEEIRRLQGENPDMLIIPGVESSPYYYWSGNPFTGTLTINDWHRHMLAFGFKDAADYEHLPVVGNSAGGAYTQYQGDLGPLPYARYVDYCAQHGALTFWTHPEAQNVGRESGVRIETRDYASLLTRVDNYTGFFIFYEGYEKIGVPEGLWDEILKDYCAGRRKRPVWAAAGLSIDAARGLEGNLKGLRTIVVVDALTQDEVVRALAAGRMYVVLGSNASSVIMDEYSLTSGAVTASLGETLAHAQEPLVVIRGRFLRGQGGHTQIKLIRNAKVIAALETDGADFSVSYRDKNAPQGKGYYRAEINGEGARIITNPVFYIKER